MGVKMETMKEGDGVTYPEKGQKVRAWGELEGGADSVSPIMKT